MLEQQPIGIFFKSQNPPWWPLKCQWMLISPPQSMKPVRLVRHRKLSNQPNGSHHHTSLARSPLECSHQRYSTGFDQMSTYKWSNYATCGSFGGPYFATIYYWAVQENDGCRMFEVSSHCKCACFRVLLDTLRGRLSHVMPCDAKSAVCAHAYKKTANACE